MKYANSLEDSDLQKVNLTNAVLGSEKLNYSNTDFYRANLTNASFKVKNSDGVNLTNCVFYESILHNTNFSGSNLKGASFYNASFKNTKFDGCSNLPEEVIDYIETQKDHKESIKKIFVSHPRIKTSEQKVFFKYICDEINKQGFVLELIEKIEEQNHAILTRIKDKIEPCSGMLIFDFAQYKIIDGQYRWWDKSTCKDLKDTHLSSPWIYVESGMAIMKEIPIFVVTDLIDDECIFSEVTEENIININNYKTDNIEDLYTSLHHWIKTKVQ